VAFHKGKLIDRTSIGVRDLKTRVPMSADTIFRAFSMTKPVTSVAMMILLEQGLWQLEDPIEKFVPELSALKVFKGIDGEGHALLESIQSRPTMHQLLTHTAGFSYGFEDGWVDDAYREADLWSAECANDFINRVARLPLAYEPGTKWRYSISTDIQGIIVERLTGTHLESFMQKAIFAPLHMNDTVFSLSSIQQSRLATLYKFRKGKLVPVYGRVLCSDSTRSHKFASGGAGLFTTADNYSRFARMLLNQGEPDGHSIIRPQTARLMTGNQISDQIANGNFGIGIHRIGPGYRYGFNGVTVTDPEKAKVALGEGSYLWDGLASTWFWIDPTNDIVFVGMVQRITDAAIAHVQRALQRAILETIAG
jgi:CubicO group peptidase (beta-lactamase class C family)